MLPIVLYTGTRTWDRLGGVRELVELGDELAERVPELQPLFLNVGQTSAEAPAQGGPFGLLLLLLAQQRRVRLPVFEQTLREVVQGLEALGEQDRARWLELLSFIESPIYNEREESEREPLVEKAAGSVQNDARRQEVIDMGRTIADALRDEGREEGRQEGELRTRRRLFVRMLRNKFGRIPAAVVRRIEATERLALLDQWFDQATTANTLNEVNFNAE